MPPPFVPAVFPEIVLFRTSQEPASIHTDPAACTGGTPLNPPVAVFPVTTMPSSVTMPLARIPPPSLLLARPPVIVNPDKFRTGAAESSTRNALPGINRQVGGAGPVMVKPPP